MDVRIIVSLPCWKLGIGLLVIAHNRYFEYLKLNCTFETEKKLLRLIFFFCFLGDCEPEEEGSGTGLSRGERSHLIVWRVPFSKKVEALLL